MDNVTAIDDNSDTDALESNSDCERINNFGKYHDDWTEVVRASLLWVSHWPLQFVADPRYSVLIQIKNSQTKKAEADEEGMNECVD